MMGYTYEYFHKDPLGNTRMVFSITTTTTSLATMEQANAASEAAHTVKV